MRILIVSALFPPDIATPAPYMKELASRLAAEHSVTVLTYGSLPESVTGANVQAVTKKLPAFLRLPWFTLKLLRLTFKQDLILIHNAPSTEMPNLVVHTLVRKPFILVLSDTKINYQGWREKLHLRTRKRATRIVHDNLPLPKPELHPFHPPTAEELNAYEASWQTHLTDITNPNI